MGVEMTWVCDGPGCSERSKADSVPWRVLEIRHARDSYRSNRTYLCSDECERNYEMKRLKIHPNSVEIDLGEDPILHPSVWDRI